MRIYGAHIYYIHTICACFPSHSAVKNPPVMGALGDVDSILGLGRSPGGGAWQPTPVFLPGESHGQRSLASYGLQGGKESDTTEVT